MLKEILKRKFHCLLIPIIKDVNTPDYRLMKPITLPSQVRLIVDSLGLDFLPSVILPMPISTRTRAKIFIP